MKNAFTFKADCFIILLIIILLLVGNNLLAAQKATNWLDEPVTILFQNEPLSKVLEKISKQTITAIMVSSTQANEKVTGDYKNVKASGAITRLFSSKNKSIQVSKEKKVIVVKTFGAKKFIWAGVASGGNDIAQLSTDKISLDEIRALQIKYYQEYRDEISDDNAVIEGNLTRAELRNIVQEQNKEFEESLKNDKEIIAGNKTRAQLRKFVEQQNEMFIKSLSNNEEIIAEGLTRVQLRNLVEKDIKKYKDSISDDNEIIEGSLTRAELKTFVQKEINKSNK